MKSSTSIDRVPYVRRARLRASATRSQNQVQIILGGRVHEVDAATVGLVRRIVRMGAVTRRS